MRPEASSWALWASLPVFDELAAALGRACCRLGRSLLPPWKNLLPPWTKLAAALDKACCRLGRSLLPCARISRGWSAVFIMSALGAAALPHAGTSWCLCTTRCCGCRLPEYADDDEDTAKGIARLFAEVGEAYINLIATAVQEVREAVQGIGGQEGAAGLEAVLESASSCVPQARRLAGMQADRNAGLSPAGTPSAPSDTWSLSVRSAGRLLLPPPVDVTTKRMLPSHTHTHEHPHTRPAAHRSRPLPEPTLWVCSCLWTDRSMAFTCMHAPMTHTYQ